MKLAISFALILLTVVCNGQNKKFFGLWIGTAEYRVENIAMGEIYDDFEYLMPFNSDGEIDTVAWMEQQKVDSIKRANWVPEPVPAVIDTNFYPVYVLLELKENGLANYKELGKPESSINWLPTSSLNEIILDSLTLKLDSANHLSLVYYEQDSLQRKILFEPISKSKLSANSDIGSLLKKQSWQFSKIDEEDKSQSSWYFENDTLTISVFNTDTATYSTPGNWMIEEFSGHYFLFIQPNYIPFYLHITELKNGTNPTILTDFYALNGFPFETKYPKIVNYSLIGSELPKQKTIAKTSQKLIGKWESIDEAFPVDYLHFNQEVLSSFLTYEFRNDGSVSINFGGEVKDDYGTNQIDKTEIFNWSLASSGNIIIFDKAYSSRNLSHFRFIDPNTIELRREMRSLEGRLVDDMVFRMKRVNN
jgi:hypothetical protein